MAIDTADKRFSMMGMAGSAIFPTPDGTIDAADRLQWLGLYRGIPVGVPVIPVIWTTASGIFTYVATRWTSVNWILDATLKAYSGTIRARLYDNTAAAAVASSEVTTTASSDTSLQSSALTLVDGNEYVAQIGAGSGDSGNCKRAVPIAVAS